jgi:hypothetical protein
MTCLRLVASGWAKARPPPVQPTVQGIGAILYPAHSHRSIHRSFSQRASERWQKMAPLPCPGQRSLRLELHRRAAPHS